MRDDIYNFLRAQLMPAAITLFLGLGFFGALAAQSESAAPAPAESAAVSEFPFPYFPSGSSLAKYPALPHTVQGMAGPITIKIVRAPVDENGEELWGSFEAATRTIEIELEASREFQWHILGHELCHATLFDSGLLNTLSDAGQEALCDAFGSARIQEMRGR